MKARFLRTEPTGDAHRHLLKRPPAMEPSGYSSSPYKLTYWLAATFLAGVLIATAFVCRYSFVQVGATLARCDRFTGQVIFIGTAGQEISRFPSFEPFRDGLATPERH